MSNLFEIASRQAFRFLTKSGAINVEDLWNIPLTSPSGKNTCLDDIAKELYTELKEDNISFVSQYKSSNVLTQQKFDLVKHIIDIRVQEREAAKLLAENAEKKQKILSLISQKQDQQLSEASLEELQALASSL